MNISFGQAAFGLIFLRLHYFIMFPGFVILFKNIPYLNLKCVLFFSGSEVVKLSLDFKDELLQGKNKQNITPLNTLRD